jgi:single-strand DNA-binding protein
MASLNKVFIIGKLGADPKVTTTAGGKVVNLSVATNEFTGLKDNRKEITDWHSITAWGHLAESAEKYLKKGSSVHVEGKLRTDTWEKEGIKQYAVRIIAESIQFLDRLKDEEAAVTE